MRGLAKYFLLLLMATAPLTAHAQLPGFFGFKKMTSRRGAQPVAPGARKGQLPPPTTTIQQAQFESLGPVVPGAIGEASMTPMQSAPNLAAPEIAPPANATEIISTSPVNESIVTAPMEPAPVPMGEVFTYPDSGTLDFPITNVLPVQETELYSTNDWFRGGQWYSKQELMMLLRSELPLVHIAIDASQTPPVANPLATNFLPFIVNSLSSKDADFTYEAGTRLTLGRILGRDQANRDHGIEFSFMGLFEYHGEANLTVTNPLSTLSVRSLLGTQEARAGTVGIDGLGFSQINTVNGFENAVSQRIVYEADFNSLEMNYNIGGRPERDRNVLQPDGRWVRHATPSAVRGVFAGFRYIRQNELFNYTSTGGRNFIIDGAGNVLSGARIPATGDYEVETYNHMFGVHFGGEVVRKRTNWSFAMTGKVGGLVNFAKRESDLSQTFDNDTSTAVAIITTTQNESVSEETLAFVAETGLSFAYYVRPNTSFRFGYNLLFINGVATATDNLGLMGGFPEMEVTGNSFYHGANLGYEMTW